MTEELITFDTAKLAKEKGFIVGNGADLFGRFYHPNKELTSNNRGDNFSAPTQSLLQRWLREKHKIYITVIPRKPHSDFRGEVMFQLISLYKDKIDGDVSSFIKPSEPLYNLYEEALEKGLQIALKLIK